MERSERPRLEAECYAGEPWRLSIEVDDRGRPYLHLKWHDSTFVCAPEIVPGIAVAVDPRTGAICGMRLDPGRLRIEWLLQLVEHVDALLTWARNSWDGTRLIAREDAGVLLPPIVLAHQGQEHPLSWPFAVDTQEKGS